MRAVVVFILLMLGGITIIKAEGWLYKDGHSDYIIVISAQASLTEQTVARELQHYIHQAGGPILRISNTPERKRKHIYIGFNSFVAALTGKSQPSDSDEGFVYMTADDNLVIYGGRDRGTSYGVYAFLEHQMGVRWYSSDFTKIPKRSSFYLRDMSHSESPAFRYRNVLYYQMQHDMALDAHNLLNTHIGYVDDVAYGKFFSFWETHTFNLLIPPEKYFHGHPEYFSLFRGERISNGQLCLSNPQVVRLLAERIAQVIRQNPEYLAYSVSQNDNMFCCECQNCQAKVALYGSQSGLLLWAVNQVADLIAVDFPDAKIVTLAYQYSRHAPKGIKPHRNVYVRLCDIECCFLHTIDAAENSAFMADLREWSKLTSNLFVFDYVTGFHQFLAPFPNFPILSQNLSVFSKYQVCGVLEEGQYNSNGGEFAELKQWVLAKLLWNPHQDAMLLARQFIDDYYGVASSDIRKYWELYCGLVTEQTHARYNVSHDNAMYTDEFIRRGEKILEHALKVSRHDSVISRRVEHVLAQIWYLQMMRNLGKATTKKIQRLKQVLRRDGIYLREGISPHDFFAADDNNQ